MKFSIPLALLVAFFLASCAEEPPPPTTQRHRASSYAATQSQEYPPQQQPFNPNGPGAAQGSPAAAGTISTPARRSAADKGGKGRLSVRNPCPRQTAPGGEPLFAWQIYRCGRIPSRDRSEGSLHRQNLPCAVTPARSRAPLIADTECRASAAQPCYVNIRHEPHDVYLSVWSCG